MPNCSSKIRGRVYRRCLTRHAEQSAGMCLSDIPRIALGFSLILPLFRSSNKAEPVRMAADPSDFGPPPRSVPKVVEMAPRTCGIASRATGDLMARFGCAG